MSGVPKGWLGCPSLPDDLIANKFLVFKTPYTKNSGISPKDKFTIKDVITHVKSLNRNFVCWIDLTNTSRYYNPSEVSSHGFEYQKMALLGHGSAPSKSDVSNFLKVCKKFDKSDGIIGVHCTHGFNRTGFLICKYLMAELKYSPEDAILHFAKCRPPGIYRQNYIEDLCPDKDIIPQAPKTPAWVSSSESSSRSGGRKRQIEESGSGNSKRPKRGPGNFYCDLPIIDCVDEPEQSHIQNMVARTSGWYLQDLFSKHNKLRNENKDQIFRGAYAFKLKNVTGRRYILYIEERDRVYFLDSDFNVYKAQVVFPMLDHHRSVRHLFKTIVIGEMRHLPKKKGDSDSGPNFTFVIEDILVFRGEYVAAAPFYDRMKIIKGNLIESRRIISSKSGSKNSSDDILSIELDQYHKISALDSVIVGESDLPEKIVFYAMREPFSVAPRTSTLEYSVVKTCVNFRIRRENGKYLLYCRDSEQSFSSVEDSESTHSNPLSDGGIVQCRYYKGKWIVDRKLSDSAHIDSIATAEDAKDHHKLTIYSLKKFLGTRPNPKYR